jgi:hypothetical protein
MELNVLDRSNYFKGLLILTGKDRTIDVKEIEIMKRLGNVLDFDEGFVMECVGDLLQNEYIIEEPLKFSSRKIAEAFITDGIKVILSNNVIESKEFNWLVSIADTNGITENFYTPLIYEYTKNLPDNLSNIKLEIENYLT